MRILFSQNGMIDFGDPVWMGPEQFEKFVRLMKRLFPKHIEVHDVEEESRHPPGGGTPRRWTVDEYTELLSGRGNTELADRLHRSEMSVRMKRGEFVPAFLAWAYRKGYTFPHSKRQVNEFFGKGGGT